MPDSDVLVGLTELDLAIARTQKSLEELPEKTAILKLRQRLREIRAVRDKAEEHARQAAALVREAEDEVSGIEAKIAAEQKKILSGEVGNPKELQAISRELDALGRRKDAVEHRQLALMEKAEEAEGQVARIDATLDEGARRDEELIAAFKKKGGALQYEIARLNAERARLAAGLDADLLAKYESVRASKHGIAVGVFDGEMCGACRTRIPAGEAQAIMAGPAVTECPNCHRILIVERDRS